MLQKKLLLYFLLVPFFSQSQSILPVFKADKKIESKTSFKISQNEKKLVKVYADLYNLSSLEFTEEIKNKKENTLKLKMDSLRVEIDSLNKLEKMVEYYPLITFYGSAAIGGGTDFLSSITSTGQLNAVVNPFGQTYVGVGANLLFANSENSVNKDSVGFNSLMFPETGKFGVLASISQKICLNPNGKLDSTNDFRNHFLVPQFSFAYRRVAIDSVITGFKVLNYNFGLKYQVEGKTKNSDIISFSVMPYFHFFNIPDEDVFQFQKFVNDSLFTNNNKNAEINAWGIKTTLQYNSFVFFFDIRRNIQTKNLTDNNPFKGTIVNVGFSTNFKISLSKKKEDTE